MSKLGGKCMCSLCDLEGSGTCIIEAGKCGYMTTSAIDKAEKILADKISAMNLLKELDSPMGIMGSKIYSALVNIITEGNDKYCEVHGHMMHNKVNTCVLCGKTVE